jgi:hypothetical protein
MDVLFVGKNSFGLSHNLFFVHNGHDTYRKAVGMHTYILIRHDLRFLKTILESNAINNMEVWNALNFFPTCHFFLMLEFAKCRKC